MMITGELAVFVIGYIRHLRQVAEWISGARSGSTNTYR